MASNSNSPLLNSDEDLLLPIGDFFILLFQKNFNKVRLLIEGIRELKCYCGKVIILHVWLVGYLPQKKTGLAIK